MTSSNLPSELILTLTQGETGWGLKVSTPVVDDGRPKPRYELVPETGTRLFRAKALRDIFTSEGALVVRAGALSGLLHGERALSQLGGSWVATGAQVLTDAQVRGDAQVKDSAIIENGAFVTGSATVSGTARIGDQCVVEGNALICDGARMINGAHVGGSARVSGRAVLYGDVYVQGSAEIGDNAHIQTGGTLWMRDGKFDGKAKISGCRDFLQIGTCWGALTVFRNGEDNWRGTVGCQNFNTFDELKVLVEDNGGSWEHNLLPGWLAMLTEAFKLWGLPEELIAKSTAVDGEGSNDDEEDDDDDYYDV